MSKNKGIAAAEKQRRREEARERQRAYNELTPKGKLAQLDAGKFRALRQRRRLEAELEQAS